MGASLHGKNTAYNQNVQCCKSIVAEMDSNTNYKPGSFAEMYMLFIRLAIGSLVSDPFMTNPARP